MLLLEEKSFRPPGHYLQLAAVHFQILSHTRILVLYHVLTLRGGLLQHALLLSLAPEDRPGAVYKIQCSDYKATYIGETGRNLITQLTEHKRATKKGDLNNNIAEHHLKTSHAIDWDSATCDYYTRKLVY